MYDMGQKNKNRINYGLICEQTLSELSKHKIKPRLLLHVCCAPCSSSVVEYLTSHFEIELYYYNPNIHPREEYLRRLGEFDKLIDGAEFFGGVTLSEGKYDTDRFFDIAEGLEGEREGGRRCEACIRLRLEETARRAREIGADFFTTTLSVSPHKNAAYINELGESLEREYGVRYLYADFKKKNGYARSIELCREFDVYRQDWCGCRFSMRTNDKEE